jgi:hypothetical protein
MFVSRDELAAGFETLGVVGRDDAVEELPGKMPALPAQTLQGHPMLLPLLSIKYSKCG